MAEEGAGKRAWNLIMGAAEISSDGAQLRLLILLILLVGVGFSGYVVYARTLYVPPVISEDPIRPAISDRNRLNAMIDNITAANAARTNSMEVATALASMGRYPMVAERIVSPTNPVVDVPAVIILPPYIRVKATMTLDGRAVALIDIEGETTGKVYRVGDRFAERKGRISRIVPERVTVVYEGKEFIYSP